MKPVPMSDSQFDAFDAFLTAINNLVNTLEPSNAAQMKALRELQVKSHAFVGELSGKPSLYRV